MYEPDQDSDIIQADFKRHLIASIRTGSKRRQHTPDTCAETVINVWGLTIMSLRSIVNTAPVS